MRVFLIGIVVAVAMAAMAQDADAGLLRRLFARRGSCGASSGGHGLVQRSGGIFSAGGCSGGACSIR